MHYPLLVASWAFASLAAAKTCMNITVPVSVTARNGVFGGIAPPESALDVTTFVQNSTKQGANGTMQALTGYTNVNGNYNISAKFCVPSGANATLANPTVQVLTHGIGFDKTYWDLPYNNYNYSYIDVATDEFGYCTLSYDRIGIGNSSHGDPINEIQAPLEIQGLRALTLMLRNGTFPQVNQTFQKIVHVGHSFGSAQSYQLTAMYPNISDGLILTGFSLNQSFISYFLAGGNFQQAALNQPLRFGNLSMSTGFAQFVQSYGLTDVFAPASLTAEPLNYPPGYFANGNVQALQYLFLQPGYFDTGLAYFGEATKQPVTVGELLTQGGASMMNMFSGPVMVITGSNDLPFCGGDCTNTGTPQLPNIPSDVMVAFRNTKPQVVIQPNTGHGINFHYNATGAYRAINSFLNAQNLTGS